MKGSEGECVNVLFGAVECCRHIATYVVLYLRSAQGRSSSWEDEHV